MGLEGEEKGRFTLGFPVKVTEGGRDNEQKREQSCGMPRRLRYDQSLTAERNCGKELSHASDFPTVHLGQPFHSRAVPGHSSTASGNILAQIYFLQTLLWDTRGFPSFLAVSLAAQLGVV